MSLLWSALSKALGVVVIAVMLGSTAVKAQGNPAEIPDELNRQVLELYSSGKYEQAIPIAEKLLETTQRERGLAYPNTAQSLNNLAALYWATGAYAKAEPLYQRALAIHEKALGPDYPDTAMSLNNLAVLFWAQGRWPEAQDDFRRSTQIEESNAQSVLALGDESRKRAYLETLTGYTHNVVSFSPCLPAEGLRTPTHWACRWFCSARGVCWMCWPIRTALSDAAVSTGPATI